MTVANKSFACLTLCLLGSIAAVRAADDLDGRAWGITEENDLFANPFGRHNDRHYTQGSEFAFGGRQTASTNWISNLPAWGIVVDTHRTGFVLGQSMYTPEDLQATAPIPTDRPYAGWLYAGVDAQRRGLAFQRVPCLESFELNLGVIGPESMAREAQTVVHRWRGFATPKGWDNQLKTEPGVDLKYERLWRLSAGREEQRYFDFLPHAGASLGNVATRADLGAALRVGYHLPDDFGPQIIDSDAALSGGFNSKSPNFSVYLFVGVEGRAVGYTTFLDGNLFRSGPHLDHVPLVADTSYGFGFVFLKYCELSYSHIFRTREFRGQRNHDEFGSITAMARFPF